jgi:hypothetical protein
MSFINTFVLKINQLPEKIACLTYMPSATGSHEHGYQSLGATASSSISHNNWPDAARKPVLLIKIAARTKS